MRKKLIALIIVIFTLICCVGITGFSEEIGEGQTSIPEGEQTQDPPTQPADPPTQPVDPPAEEPEQPSTPPSEQPTEAPVITDAPTAAPTAEPTPVPSVPFVYKHPSAEVVKSGEGCIFVARAENYTAINWYFTKNDQIVYAAEAAKQFPGLRVSGDGTEIFSLESVPESLDGWSVGAIFSNAVGKQGTTTCTITVTAPASPSPAATASPKPTASPSPTERPVTTAAPAVTPMITGTVLISPSPEIEPEKTERGGFPFGMLLIAVLVLVILVALAALLILERKSSSKQKEKTKKAVINNVRNDDNFDFDLKENKKAYRGKH